MREEWENQLRRVIQTSRGDSCSADVLVSGFNWNYGFFSRIDLVINELGVAMYFNQSVAICGGGPFLQYFETILYVRSNRSVPECKGVC